LLTRQPNKLNIAAQKVAILNFGRIEPDDQTDRRRIIFFALMIAFPAAAQEAVSGVLSNARSFATGRP
jgi:hypothetical protein